MRAKQISEYKHSKKRNYMKLVINSNQMTKKWAYQNGNFPLLDVNVVDKV